MSELNLRDITQTYGATAAVTFHTLWLLSQGGKKPIKMGVRQIAREAALSTKTTQRAVNMLETGEYIQVERGTWQGGKIAPNEIRVIAPATATVRD